MPPITFLGLCSVTSQVWHRSLDGQRVLQPKQHSVVASTERQEVLIRVASHYAVPILDQPALRMVFCQFCLNIVYSFLYAYQGNPASPLQAYANWWTLVHI